MNSLVHHAECSCGCGKGFMVTYIFEPEEDDNGVYISTTTSGFMARQGGIIETIKLRLKSAWFMLRGKEYLSHDIYMDKQEWNTFLKSMNEI